MNLANRLTLARIALVPVVMFFLLWDAHDAEWVPGLKLTDLMALGIFWLAALTDWVDGWIARRYQMITNFGKFLDPLADKLLVSAVLVVLVQLQRLDAWMAVVIISREFAVTGLRVVAASAGVVIAASQWGKLKTVVQFIALSILILNNYPFAMWGLPLDQVSIWAAVVMTLVSGWDYFQKNRQVFARSA